jgi:hypothetical protein
VLRYRARGDRPLAGLKGKMSNDDGIHTVYIDVCYVHKTHHRSPRQLVEVEFVKVRPVGSVVSTKDIHGVFVNDGSMRVTGGRRWVELLRYGAPFVLDPKRWIWLEQIFSGYVIGLCVSRNPRSDLSPCHEVDIEPV